MPNRDGTGPQGQGPRSGRNQGKCFGKGNQQSSGRDKIEDRFPRRQGKGKSKQSDQ